MGVHVVFVHGLFSSRNTWSTMAALVTADRDLAESLDIRYFEYPSPRMRLRPDRRIPDLAVVGRQLGTYLNQSLPDDNDPIVLVTHSQGGLVVQQYLADACLQRKAAQLRRIRQIVMYACPTTGSEFLVSLRRAAWFWQHPQERQLRPINEAVMSAHQTVIERIVFARTSTDSECPIPIAAYGGSEDAIVPARNATWGFLDTGVVPGDHSSLIRPTPDDDTAFRVLKRVLTTVAEVAHEQQTETAPGQDNSRTETETGDEDTAGPQSTAVPRAGSVPRILTIEPPWHVRNRPLRGRDRLLAEIDQDHQHRVHILTGEGGVGKSRLALELAYRAQQRSEAADHGPALVWWVHRSRVSDSMRRVATSLGASETRIERAWLGNPANLVWSLLDGLQRPWLLIFDGANDPPQLAAPGERIADGLGWLREPAAAHGRVIVTSRQGDKSIWEPWGFVRTVPTLDAFAGAAVLYDIYPQGGSVLQARELSSELGGLPLRLRQAGMHLGSESKSEVYEGPRAVRTFDDYRHELQRRWDYSGEAHGDIDAVLGLDLTRQVIDLSLSLAVARGSRDAPALLKLLACLNIAPIPYYTLLETDALEGSDLLGNMTTRQANGALKELVNVGLAQIHPYGPDTPGIEHLLSLHPEYHHLLREYPDARERHAEYYSLAVDMLTKAVEAHDPDDPRSWPIWNRIAPHANQLARTALLGPRPLRDLGAVRAAINLARLTLRYLVARGLLTPASELAHDLIDGCAVALLDADDPEILSIRHEQARIALERGDRVTAEHMYREILAQRTAKLAGGERHPDTLASRHKLARAILEQGGRAAEAEAELRAIVKLEKTVRGAEHSDTMVVRRSLARALIYQQRPDEALPMLNEILEISLRKWPPTRPETLWVRHTLARCQLELGDFTAAEAETRTALALIESQDSGQGADRHLVMAMTRTQAVALMGQGQFDEAYDIVARLQQDAHATLDPTDPLYLRIMALWNEIRQELLDSDLEPAGDGAAAEDDDTGDSDDTPDRSDDTPQRTDSDDRGPDGCDRSDVR